LKIIDINNQERNCEKAFLDKNWPGYVTVILISKNNPEKKHTEWIPSHIFQQNNPNYQEILDGNKTITPLPPQTAGIVTSATKNSLSDKTKNWQKNIYASFFCWISRGTGEGQVRTIISNTKSKIKIDKPWDKNPNNTSQYTIVYQRPTATAQNNSLPNIN
jgi:hypothetical protein